MLQKEWVTTMSQLIESDSPIAKTRPDISALGPWFHNLHLPDGTQTCPDHWLGDFPTIKWNQIAPHLPQDLHGWSCLDIGCNAGFYSFALAQRGATVLGIDVDDHYLTQARWAAKEFHVEDRVHFKRMQVYDLANYNPATDPQFQLANRKSQIENSFDLVLFMGVLYHLRYPMLGLDIVSQKVKRLMLFQTLTTGEQEVFEHTYGRK